MGSPVDRDELAAHIKGIDQSFQEVREDIRDMRDTHAADRAEILLGVQGIRDELARFREQREKDREETARQREADRERAEDSYRWDRRSFLPPLVAIPVAAGVSVLSRFFH